MALRAMSTATRRPGLKSASLACTALVSLGLWAEAGAESKPGDSPAARGAGAQHAQSGQTILLAPGAYGPLQLYGRKFAGTELVIEAQPGTTPVFTAIDIGGIGRYITLKNVEVDIQTARFGVNVDNSHRISLVGLTIHSPSNKPPNGMMLRDQHGSWL